MSKSTASCQIHSEREITLPLQAMVTSNGNLHGNKNIGWVYLPYEALLSAVCLLNNDILKSWFPWRQMFLLSWSAKWSIWRRLPLWSCLILCYIFNFAVFNKWFSFLRITFEKTIISLVCPYRVYPDRQFFLDWLMFNVQRAIFQLYSGREHVYNKSLCRLKTGDG